MDDSNSTFGSTDLYLTAALRASGFALRGLKWSDNRATWLLENDPRLQRAIADFYAGKLLVDALAICEALKDTKRSLYRRIDDGKKRI